MHPSENKERSVRIFGAFRGRGGIYGGNPTLISLNMDS
jgi:hypothetical protein